MNIRMPCLLILLLALGASREAVAQATIVTAGAGSYASALPTGAKGPPAAIFATPAATGKMPTNDWWSSLAWVKYSERHYPHPLAVEAGAGGLRLYYPGNNITATKAAIFGFMPPRADDLIIGHSAQAEFPDARVDGWSDWFVSVKFAADQHALTTSYGHGSPFVYARYEGGTPQVTLAKPPQVWHGDKSSSVLGITINGRHYGLFAPTGSTWSGLDTAVLRCETSKNYFSAAVLPDNKPATLELFQKYAYAHVTDSQVSWSIDEKTRAVTTKFTVKTTPQEGTVTDTLLCLYPHQWRHTSAKLSDLQYNSVRGAMKVWAGSELQTTHRFPGILPTLPKVAGCDPAVMEKLLAAEAKRETPLIRDTYWDGKWLGKTATLIPIAEQFGQQEMADELRAKLRTRLEQWLSTQAGERSGLFAYDDRWGTLIGYPASYGSDNDLNDHHFHYGYFIRAAAEIARHDPEWAKDERWGAMIKLLIRDTASPDRHDPLFPFLRNFDPYAGHSWASGNAKFGDGNNNESSSEAMNAWYGLILWGEFTGDRALRDLGIYLYTTEMHAIQEYWFDVHDENHPASYSPSVVTMVWGGKGANGTWFSANPEMVHGINWLPIHGGSLYLGHSPQYVRKNYAALVEENGGASWDDWADLIWMYRALSDPADAREQFTAGHESRRKEAGNSLPNAYHWICALQELGHVNPNVTADQTCYAVFDAGATRGYVVYNHTGQPITATFSDGHKLLVPAKSLHMGKVERKAVAPSPKPNDQ